MDILSSFFTSFTICKKLTATKQKEIKILPPTGKSTLRLFCIKSTSILGNCTGFSLLTRETWLYYFPGFEK